MGSHVFQGGRRAGGEGKSVTTIEYKEGTVGN